MSYGAGRPNQKPLPMKLDTSLDACGPGCYKLEPGALIVPLAHPDMPHVPPGMEAAPPSKRRLKKATLSAKGRHAARMKRPRVASEELARVEAIKWVGSSVPCLLASVVNSIACLLASVSDSIACLLASFLDPIARLASVLDLIARLLTSVLDPLS